MEARNVFVIGLEPFAMEALQTVRLAATCRFHPLLSYQEVVRPERLCFGALLDKARSILADTPGSVDAIINHWDFPGSVLAPILCREYGIPSPSLESVMRCEHKYWSRMEQVASIPEVVPPFCHVDPFDARAKEQITLDYPFWIKPVKAFASQLGFAVHDAAELDAALSKIRARITHIGDAFNDVLNRLDLPPEIAAVNGNDCLAEAIIEGRQVAPEGYVFQGNYHIHGMLDMLRDENGKSFSQMVYPAAVPASVQQRMIQCTERFLRHIGFDNGCFNAEFFWDEARDRLWLIEVNTRLSQSHSDLFEKVDGMSNHELAISVALGERPHFPRGEGPYGVAAKCTIRHYGGDAIVTRIPDGAALSRVREVVPDTRGQITVGVGDRLSDLPNQDSYSYALANLYIGARDRSDLEARFQRCKEMLPFEFTAV